MVNAILLTCLPQRPYYRTGKQTSSKVHWFQYLLLPIHCGRLYKQVCILWWRRSTEDLSKYNWKLYDFQCRRNYYFCWMKAIHKMQFVLKYAPHWAGYFCLHQILSINSFDCCFAMFWSSFIISLTTYCYPRHYFKSFRHFFILSLYSS